MCLRTRSKHTDLTAGDGQYAGDHLEKGALASAIRSDDGNKFPRVQVKGDSIQRVATIVADS